MKKEQHRQEQHKHNKSKGLSQFIGSFRKLDLRFIVVAGYDLCFFAVFMVLLKLWVGFVQRKGETAMSFNAEQIAGMASEEAAKQVTLMKGFVGIFLATFIFLLIAIFLLWCLSNLLIWTTVLRKKFSAASFKRFLLFNLLQTPLTLICLGLIAAVTAIFVSLINLAKPAVGSDILFMILITPFVVLLYLPTVLILYNIANLAYMHFTKGTTLLFGGIGQAFALTFSKSIIPLYKSYVMMGVVFILLSQSFWVIDLIPDTIGMIIAGALLLLYSSWVRFYLTDVVESIE